MVEIEIETEKHLSQHYCFDHDLEEQIRYNKNVFFCSLYTIRHIKELDD